MKNTNLIYLLKKLSTRERTRFRELVFSPFFNKNKKVQMLCDWVLKYAPHFENEALNKKEIFEKIFPSKTFDEIKLNNIISDLLQLLYDFLGQKQFANQRQLQTNLVMRELLEKDAGSHILKMTRRYQLQQKQNPHRSSDFFWNEQIFYEHLDQFIQTKVKRQFDENLQLQSDNLDRYYFVSKLRIACNMVSRNIVINAEYECHFLEEILKFYKKKFATLRFPSLDVYFHCLRMLTGKGKEKFYFDFKELLTKHHHLFPKDELFTLYNYALNFCIKKINIGKNSFYQEILELYKLLLEGKIIFLNGYLTQWTFKNIVTTAIRLKEFDWTQQFIYEYKNALLPEEQNNAFAYNMAALYHAQNDFRNALFQLQDVEFTDTNYHLGAKIIQVKSYFELEEEEAFLALMEAFKKYVLRSKNLSEYRKKANANFLKLAKKIFQLKMMSAKNFQNKRDKIFQELKNLEPLANKSWLEEKINQLN